MALALGASSYLDGKRYTNISDIKEYINDVFNGRNIQVLEEIETKESKIREYIILGLRKISGINICEINKLFDIDVIKMFSKELEKLLKLGLIECNESIRLTPKGLDLANIVWEEFV